MKHRRHHLAVLLSAAILPCRSAAQVPEWTLDRELTIGDASESATALTWSTHLAVDADGTMYLAQPLEGVIRVFDASGHFSGFIGRPGRGPGEFTDLSSLGIHGDTLWASDGDRVHFFARDGGFLHTVRLRYTPGRRDFRAAGRTDLLHDGRLLTAPTWIPDPDPSGPTPEGLPVLSVGRGGRSADEIGRLDFGFLAFFEWQGVRYPAPRPLHPMFLYDVAPSGDLVAFVVQAEPDGEDEQAFHVVGVTQAGDTLFDRAVDYRPIRVSDSVRDGIESAVLGSVALPVDRERQEAMLAAVPVPRFYPPVGAIRVGSDGSIWLRMQGHRPVRWLVLDRTGQPRGQVRGTAGLREVVAASADHVWAIEVDEDDVPRLVRFRIERG